MLNGGSPGWTYSLILLRTVSNSCTVYSFFFSFHEYPGQHNKACIGDGALLSQRPSRPREERGARSDAQSLLSSLCEGRAANAASLIARSSVYICGSRVESWKSIFLRYKEQVMGRGVVSVYYKGSISDRHYQTYEKNWGGENWLGCRTLSWRCRSTGCARVRASSDSWPTV